MGHSGAGRVSKVIIVAIAPVLELTPVQVIQARPTGSRVFVMDNEKGEKEFVTRYVRSGRAISKKISPSVGV